MTAFKKGIKCDKKESRRGRNLVLLLAIVFCVLPQPALLYAQGEDLRVFANWLDYSDSKTLSRRYLNSIAFDQLKQREQRIGKLNSAEDWRQRQAEVKATLRRVLGPFPERNPLNARITKTVRKAGFRVEHVVFESRPRFYVTGSLFLPEGLEGKAPAILNVIGHTNIAYRAPSYQQFLLNLVQKGFIVFAIDPIGQGERLQYFDTEQGRSLIGGSTAEHSYVGKQCFLSGDSLANYFTWDGIRAIDYLVSRPEVDAERIGVTGISGGGTQTSYISALDDRVEAAAPANYICGFRRLLQSIGPQDAEQNFNGGIVNGIDHGDFLEVRAPKPTLLVATTRDFFSIQGARETFAEAKRAYEAFARPENLEMVEDEHGHGYTKKNREATYAFFQKHLENPGDPTDREVELLTFPELTVTPTGQLIGSLGGETVFSLNLQRTRSLVRALHTSRSDLPAHLEKVKQKAQELSGYRQPDDATTVVFRGRFQRPGYVIEQYFLEGETVVPFLLFKPDQPERPATVLYLHPGGKDAETGPGGEIEWLVGQGFAVLSADLFGTGELGEAVDSSTFVGVLTGRTVPGIRAAETIRLFRFISTHPDLTGARVAAVARGGMVTPLVHAAAWEPGIAQIALIEPFLSFASVALNRFYQVSFSDVVPNALTAYDLADLQAALAPRPLLIANPQDQLLQPAGSEAIEREYGIVREAYSARQAAGKAHVHQWKQPQELRELLSEWLR
jgi:dienelactone hydrolase